MSTPALDYDHLALVMSPERLAPYLSEAKGSKPLAAELYAWNVEISGALWDLIVYLEVATRNAMARELQTLCVGMGSGRGPVPQWYNHRAWFTTRQNTAIQDAKTRVRGKGLTSGRVIAQLTFGFWVSLVDPAHAPTLWIPGLHKAFPNSPGGHGPVRAKLGWVNDIRNDIAHHNRLFGRKILDVEQELMRTAFWVDPKLADWMSSVSAVRAANARRPDLPPTLRWPVPTPTP